MRACNKRLPDEARALDIELELYVRHRHTLQTHIYLNIQCQYLDNLNSILVMSYLTMGVTL